MPWRLRLAEDRLFPVQAFFNAVSDDSFLRVVRSLLSGVGYGAEYAICTFPTDLDPGEEPFEGVLFSIFEDDVVLTIGELRQYIERACAAYVAAHPEQRQAVADLLSRA